MNGWLYERVAEDLKPFGLTPREYVQEMVDEVGPRWSLIHTCLLADIGRTSWMRTQFPSPSTLKNWVNS